MEFSVKYKICGLRRPEDIRAVNRVRPDFAGFIFDPTRRRYISPETAAELISMLDPSIAPVGVFVNADPETVIMISKICSLAYVQLHGQENEDYISDLRARPDFTCRIINAFRIDGAADLEAAAASSADLILLDHGIGGTGEAFDWSLIRHFPRPFLLAGGISEENINEAFRLAHPYGVDISSSLETDGRKDPDKIRVFSERIETIRSNKRS